MTVGENGFGPPGSRRGALSVGLGGGAVVVVVVVVVELVSGAFSSSLAHDAVSMTIAVIAEPPATAATRRTNTDFMVGVLTVAGHCRPFQDQSGHAEL
jgi:hypothetical protein